jgi:uncharacterized coiled-coil DUF342 family protein
MGWTIKSLKEHFNALFKEREEKVNERFASIKEAIRHADDYAHYRDEKSNEFRKSLDDLSERAAEREKEFVNKIELKSIEKQFDIWMSGMKQVQEANFNVCMNDIRKIEKDVDKIKHVKQGGNQAWIILVAGAGVLLGFLALAVKIFMK